MREGVGELRERPAAGILRRGRGGDRERRRPAAGHEPAALLSDAVVGDSAVQEGQRPVADGGRLHEAAQPQHAGGRARASGCAGVPVHHLRQGAEREDDCADAEAPEVPHRHAFLRAFEGRPAGPHRPDAAPPDGADRVRLHSDPLGGRRPPPALSR